MKEKEEENFEENPIVKRYFSRIFTVLPEEIRQKILKLNLSKNELKKLSKELAFLPEEKQQEFLTELNKFLEDMENKKEE
ncbi:MAG: hypothetical protein GF317_02890 [Candidatus Lokiarchaeota archaeon]|nr:hypothetical protein [Candidatus Lokiarchaeota archaeon]MBD3198853.1 hypothetical protein [Candidatus Lokiarchaeota archaeon]